MSRRIYQIIILLAVVVCLPAAALACPTCKEALASNNPNLVRGYGWSIMFMMSAPFLILAGLGGYFYYEIRRAQARQALAAQSVESDTAMAGTS